jgi:hypothetical protein
MYVTDDREVFVEARLISGDATLCAMVDGAPIIIPKDRKMFT